jgi:hypothetical protein
VLVDTIFLPDLPYTSSRDVTPLTRRRATPREVGPTEHGLESAEAEGSDVLEGRVQGQSCEKDFKGDGRKEKGHGDKDRVPMRTRKNGGTAEDSEA